ncbi:MAG TPA: hypothetical protein VFH68_05335 [Polyangia bacterium]|nr:hypothetical protein [Polyangia bacterium]
MTAGRRVHPAVGCLAAGLAWHALVLARPAVAAAAVPAAAAASKVAAAGAQPVAPAGPGTSAPSSPPAASQRAGFADSRTLAPGTVATTTTTTTTAPTPTPTGLREPAPRPVAEVRIQGRYAHNVGTVQLFAGVDYLERRDFHISPGVRLGATYFVWEWLGLELQLSRYFSQLNKAGLEVEQMLGVVPDSRAPTWLLVAGGRLAFGYGKMMIAGIHRSIHFEPQALLQAGIHVHDGSIGPSGLAGLGLMIHATPRWFFRLEGGVTVEVERRVTGTTTVVGFLPSLVTGGVF